MSKHVKKLMMDEMRQAFAGVRDLLVVDLKGVDAISDNAMRLKLREKEIHLRVVRNSLARKVFTEAGITGVCDYFEGPSAIVWGGPSVVDLAKEIAEWADKVEPLNIKGGVSDGETISAADVVALSKMPSREEMLGMIVGQVLSPGARLCGLILSPGGRLASQLKSRAEEESQTE